MIISDKLKRLTDLFGISVPGISITYLPGLKELTKKKRHSREASILKRVAKQFLEEKGRKKKDIKISWLESGKPVVDGGAFKDYDISLSHNRGTVLSVAGEGPQGCDIESITRRSREEWVALFGKKRASLLDSLVGDSESIDKAGTRIWTVMEAAFKASGSKNTDLQVEKKEAESVLFTTGGSDDEVSTIVTFPVTMTRGPEKMIALTVRNSEKIVASTPSFEEKSHAEKLNFNMESYQVRIENGPQDQPVFYFLFPVTFKEASNISKTLYFSNYFVWLGKLREYMIQPIYDKLVEYFSSGNWGMVTNHAETHIFGAARSGDVVEGCLWLDKVSGNEKSTLDFMFEWRKKNAQGADELIASSTMSTTWVSILDHGVVEIEPLPQFGKEFVSKLLPQKPQNEWAEKEQNLFSPPDFGHELFREPVGPVRASAFLMEKVFETCLEDSNLVGNIYFSNYYTWQGRVRDHFLHKVAPEYSMNSGKQGEFRCVRCEVNHLSEAMPYDRIAVKMHRSAVFEKGAIFYFDYYRVDEDGGHRKLGHGIHEALWFAPASGQPDWKPSRIPPEVRNALTPEEETTNCCPASGYHIEKSESYDVIVVGAGIGGLTAAGLLAKRGAKVLVVEQHDKPGGFCTSWKRVIKHKGDSLRFVFDSGVHDIASLGEHRHIPSVLSELGGESRIKWFRTEHEYIVDGLRIIVPQRFEDYIDLLINKFPEEREGLISLFNQIVHCYDELFNQKKDIADSNLMRWQNVPFLTMIQRYVHNRTLIKILSILSCYVTHDLSSLSVISAIPLFSYYIEGGCYPAGSSQVLSDTLADAIEKFGSEVRLNTPVNRIVVNDSKAVGVVLRNGQMLNAEKIISNADVIRTFTDLIGVEQLPNYFSQRIGKLRPSNSAFMVFLCVDYVPEIKPVTICIDDEMVVAIMNPSQSDPSLAPSGYACLTIISLLSPEKAKEWNRDNPEYKRLKTRFGRKLIEIAKKVIPDLNQHIIFEQEASPATFSRYAWTSDGAIYGLAIDEWRPPAVKTPIDGLFLSGAGTSLHPGVEYAALSGINVANKILPLRNE
jgi:phytoene dehydrogenase-like protein/acyl-CoA thioesterase FadM